MKTDSTENMLVGSRTTEKHGDGGNVETENSLDKKQKSILVIDTPEDCLACPCFSVIGSEHCSVTMKEVGLHIPMWCPLKHPLKEVSNNFYIYDTEYLFKNLDREIDLLKSAERFKEYMRNREK